MRAMVTFDVRPLNVALTWSVCAVGSSITVAVPVPGVATGGTSLAPLRSPTNVMGTAGAGVDCSTRAAKPSKPNERYFISASSLRNLLINGVVHRLAVPMLSCFLKRRNSIQAAAPVTSAAGPSAAMRVTTNLPAVVVIIGRHWTALGALDTLYCMRQGFARSGRRGRLIFG